MSRAMQRLAEPFDVHRVARGKMLEAALQLRGARRVLASPDRFVLAAHELALASRAVRGHLPALARGPCGPGFDDAHDLRNDVARFFDDDAIAVADVLPRHLVGVVQRRHRHGRARDEHRLEHGERRHRAGAPDVDVDLRQASFLPAPAEI